MSVPVHSIAPLMRKILHIFDNVVSGVSLVLILTNELWLSKPTIVVSTEGENPAGTSM